MEDGKNKSIDYVAFVQEDCPDMSVVQQAKVMSRCPLSQSQMQISRG